MCIRDSFRYQPGRVSAATFGVKTTTIGDSGSRNSQDTTSGSSNNVNGSAIVNKAVLNPTIRKYGIFDNFDGYYWETRNNGQGDNFSVVRRTQAVTQFNPVAWGIGAGQQSQDYGTTNPVNPLGARASESIGAGATAVPTGYTNREFGDLVVLRDNLLMTHAGVYDPSILQDEHKVEISSISAGSTDAVFSFNPGSAVGLAVSISNAVYDNITGLTTVTTHTDHGFNGISSVSIASSGGGYGTGGASDEVYFNAKLVSSADLAFPTVNSDGNANAVGVGSTTGVNATVKVTVDKNQGGITAISIMNLSLIHI